MPLTLVATPGAANANTYATEAEAQAFADERFPPVATWSTANPDTRRRALVEATRLLDRMAWAGDRASDLQALEWPRAGVRDPGRTTQIATTVIPPAVRDATCRLALWLLEQPASLLDQAGQAAGLASLSLGSELSLSFEPGATSRSSLDRFLDDQVRPRLRGLVTAAHPRLVRG